MGKRTRLKRIAAAPDIKSTPAQRVSWLLDEIWEGNRSEMARAVGVTHSVLGKIAAGEQNPGRRLLEAISKHPKVNPAWLFSGEGSPLLAEKSQEPLDGWPVKIAAQLLPGPVEQHRNLLLDDAFLVAGALYRPSRYCYRINPRDPIANDRRTYVTGGDLLLVDSDDQARQQPEQVDMRFCVIRSNAAELRLAFVTWDQGSRDDPPGLYADTFSNPIGSGKRINRITILQYPDGRLETHQEKLVESTDKEKRVRLRQASNITLMRPTPSIRLDDIVGVGVMLFRKHFTI
jgi:hypothetical protein